MTTHAMLDLETLDIEDTAVILTVGGVKFDPFKSNTPHSEFYYRLEIENQMERGRTTNDATMKWWSEQDAAIIEEAFGDDNRQSVERMLADLKKWFVGCDRVWAQGICFDISKLEHISKQYGYPIPWAFWQVEDCRTMLNRMPTDPRKAYTFAAHNALEDARMQAICLQQTMAHFGMKK